MKLIINADDFGLSESINDGIIKGINEGCITDTTLMVNTPYTKDAIDKALKNNISCIGLHINFTKGKPIISNTNLTDENGYFLSRENQLNNKVMTYQDAYDEIIEQIKKFNEYSKGKIKIDHFDCHHFLMNNDIIKQAVEDISKKFDIPVRRENNINAKCPDIIYMDFSLEDVSINSIKRLISLYKDKDIVVELMVHPGYIDEYTKTITSYLKREEELNILLQAKQDALFKDVELISFSQF